MKRKPNAALSDVNMIHGHSLLDKREKFWFIRIFCARIDVPKLHAWILGVIAVAANMGITNHIVDLM